jgi:hypothetical protein
MPGAVVNFLISAFIDITIALAPAIGANAAMAVAALTLAVGVNTALSAISKALMPDMPVAADRAKRILKSYKGTSEPRRVIYGTARVGGHIAFEGLSGDTNQYYWRVIVLGTTNGAPYESITHLHIDDNSLDLSTDIDGSGIVNTGDYSGYVMINTHLGSDTQTDDTDLTAAITPWTTAHDGKGLCYVVLRLERNDDIFGHWPDFTFTVKGAKLYDPRLDSTNGGSGAHRYATPSTWAWSENPALALRDYITCDLYGMGEDNTRIDDTTVASSANECEETVSIPSSTQDRYTCNGIISTDQRHSDNIAAIRTSMLGVLTYTRGEYSIIAGSYDAPTVSLTDDDLAGGISVDTITGDELYNSVRGKYLSSARRYQYTSFVPQTDSSYVTEDNSETKWRDIDLPMVVNEHQAQRHAMILVKQSRNKLRVTGEFKLSAYRLKIFETVSLTISEFSWSAKVFRVIGWQFNPQGTVTLNLQEEVSTAWSDPDTGDYGTPGSTTVTSYNASTPTKPTSISAAGVYGGIVVSWEKPGDNSADMYEVAEYTASTPVTSGSVVWTGRATSCMLPKTTSVTRYYWVRSARDTRKSGWRGSGETTTGVGATSLLPSTEALTGTLDKSTASGAGGTPVTTDTVTCTAAGGSGTGYTYSWSRVSGDTTITANSSSSAATTFNGTTNDDEAVFKCAVDDSASNGPVDSDYVTVTIGSNALSASVPSSVTKQFNGSSSQTTSSKTCTATGGTPTYSYAWTRVSGNTAITADSSTSASTTFSISVGETVQAVWKCTVTDSAGSPAVVDSNNITIYFVRLDE